MWSLLSSRVEASVSCPKMQSLRCTGGQSDLFDGGNVCSMCSFGGGDAGQMGGNRGAHMLRLCEAECHVELQSGDSRQAAPALMSDPEPVRMGNPCCPLSDGQAHSYLQQPAWCCLHLLLHAHHPAMLTSIKVVYPGAGVGPWWTCALDPTCPPRVSSRPRLSATCRELSGEQMPRRTPFR